MKRSIAIFAVFLWFASAGNAFGWWQTLTSMNDWPSGLTSTELGYVDGVTSSVQVQIDSKSSGVGSVNSAKAHLIQSIYNIVYHGRKEQQCHDKAGLAEGTNDATLKITNAADFMISDIIYAKAATDNIAMTAQPVQAVSTYCLYLVSIDAAGAVNCTKGFEKATDVAVLPPLNPVRAPLGYFKVVTDADTTFTCGTTDLGAAGLTVTYVDMFMMPYLSAVCPDKIRGLWIFDQTGAVATIADRGACAHTVDLSLNASSLNPAVIGLAPQLNFNASGDWWDTVDHDDFSFGNGTTDFPFSLIFCGIPASMTGNHELMAKQSLVTGATQREWRLGMTSGQVYLYCDDDSAAAVRGRYNSAAFSDAGTLVTYMGTYSGSGAPLTGIRGYRNGVRTDNTSYTTGTYTAMENKATKVANYYLSTAGVKTSVANAKYSAALIVADELTAEQVRRLDMLLRGWANSSLN